MNGWRQLMQALAGFGWWVGVTVPRAVRRALIVLARCVGSLAGLAAGAVAGGLTWRFESYVLNTGPDNILHHLCYLGLPEWGPWAIQVGIAALVGIAVARAGWLGVRELFRPEPAPVLVGTGR